MALQEFRTQIARTTDGDGLLGETEDQQALLSDELDALLGEFEVLTGDDLQLYQENKDKGKLMLTTGNADKLKPGDLLEIKYYKLSHLVVVENIRTQPNRPLGHIIVEAIHYGRPDLLTPNRIIRESFELNLTTRQCWLYVFPVVSCYPPETVLQRARSRLNEKQHSPLSNHAAHFAMWCKTQSPSHRPECLVPIYLSDRHHNHKVKAGDHLNFKCNSNRTLHAEVTQVVAMGDSSLLTVLVREDDLKDSSIPFLHQTQKRLDGEILQVIQTSNQLSSAELNRRVQLLDKLSYCAKTSSLSICLLLTDPNLNWDDWQRKVKDAPSSYKMVPLCQKVNPTVLKPGDIIYWKDVYRVVTDVQLDESGPLVSTVQYSPGPIKDGIQPFEVKILIDKHEKDTVLCVHNEVALDCHLYGGGRDLPSYSAMKVTDVRLIRRGSVISLRRAGFYQHSVVIRNSVLNASGKLSNLPPTKSSLEVMTYALDPSLSFEQFEIALKTIDIDTCEHEVHLIEFKVPENGRFSEDEVVARACARQGERQHNLLWNSGRDFARWCSIKHPSNREQCQVPIASATQLLEFQRGHVKFLKQLAPYVHDAILRECSSVEGLADIVRVRIYENNHAFKVVRTENLHVSNSDKILRVRYEGLQTSAHVDLNDLINCTFLNADDDRKGWTGKAKKCGSRVTSQDFCYWLKALKRHDGLQDIQMLFGDQLTTFQRDLSALNRLGSLSLENGLRISLETEVAKDAIQRFDHIILTRVVNGKNAEVHFVVTEWDDKSCTGVGVTYELPSEKQRMGFKEFNGFLRITGPGQIDKVVHNSELNWEMIDAKFQECLGAKNYNLIENNCEHFANFLIYGRLTSLQISDLASSIVHQCPSFALQAAHGVEKFKNLISRLIRFLTDVTPSVPDGKTFWAEGISLVVVLGFTALELALLEWRRSTTGMSNQEVKQRRISIVSSLLATLAGLGAAVLGGITSLLPVFGISVAAMGIGWAAPRVPAILEAVWRP